MPRRIRKGLRRVVDEKYLDDIPNVPGVYALYYYGKRRCIGQAKNLQRRLKQHFIEDVGFTEFTWYETAMDNTRNLESKLSS